MRDEFGQPIPTRDYEDDEVHSEPSLILDEALVRLKQNGVPARTVGSTANVYDTITQFRHKNDRAHTYNQVCDLVAAVEHHCKAKGLCERITTPLALLARKCGYVLIPRHIAERTVKLTERAVEYAKLNGFITNVMTQIETSFADRVVTRDEADRINSAIDQAEKHLESFRNEINDRVQK